MIFVDVIRSEPVFWGVGSLKDMNCVDFLFIFMVKVRKYTIHDTWILSGLVYLKCQNPHTFVSV